MRNDVPRVRLINRSSSPVSIWVEPIGDNIIVPPRHALELEYITEIDGANDVVVEDKRVILGFNAFRATMVDETGARTVLWE